MFMCVDMSFPVAVMFDPHLLDLYSERMKALIAQVPAQRPLTMAEGTAQRHSPLCGSRVTLSVVLDKSGCLQQIGYNLDACSLATAATAIVLQAAPGSSVPELEGIRHTVYQMLKEQPVTLPTGKWADIEILQPAALVKSRHSSVLLPFDTLLAAMSEAMMRRGASTHSSTLKDTYTP